MIWYGCWRLTTSPANNCTFNQRQCPLPQVNQPSGHLVSAGFPSWERKKRRKNTRLETVGVRCSFISGMIKLEIANKKLFLSCLFSSFHLAILKWRKTAAMFRSAGLSRLIALLFVRLGAADLRKKTGSTFSSSFYIYETGVPQRACGIHDIQKKYLENTHPKKTHQGVLL